MLSKPIYVEFSILDLSKINLLFMNFITITLK